MENASKALIIAGAILLSILIIGLGMFIYGQASSVLQGVNMSEQEITAFNSPFLAYEGTNVRGANVNALLQKIISNNLANQDDTSKQITVTDGSSVKIKADNSGIETKAQTGKTYIVEFEKGNKGSGLITGVKITVN